MTDSLLTISNLDIALPEGSERTLAVENLSVDLAPGETLCIVGESGSGKSLTARALMGLLPAPHVKVSRGAIDFCGEDLTQASERRLREIRGSEISMVFQEPMTALNPVMTIGSQIDEIFRFHANMSASSGANGRLSCWTVYNCPTPSKSSALIRMNFQVANANAQ